MICMYHVIYWPVLFLFAVLVASVVRTRMHDMESMMNQEQAPKQTHHLTAAPSDVTVLPDSDREIAKELKWTTVMVLCFFLFVSSLPFQWVVLYEHDVLMVLVCLVCNYNYKIIDVTRRIIWKVGSALAVSLCVLFKEAS